MFKKVKENLEKNGFQVSCFGTAKEAAEYLNQQIDQQTVGFGGSMTLEEMGLYESLSTHKQVKWHHRVPEGKTKQELRVEANAADIYISSVNGLSENGEIINIDGTGNRVSSTLYGHKKVYFIIGVNKIAPDFDSALWRARNIASPKNAQRLGRKTPCAVKADKCYNCSSPERICRGLVVLWQRMKGIKEMEVVIVNQELGY